MEIDSGADCLNTGYPFEKKEKGVVVEDFQTLKVASHNINGIKGNSIKLELLLDWARKENIDMIGINETNTTGRQNIFNLKNQDNYLGILSDAEENKKKVSGVGLILCKKWEKHLSQVKRRNAYYLETLFVFKRHKVLVLVIYIPHNDPKIRKDIQQQVIKRTLECQRKEKATKVIILGDFNDIRCRELDQNREDSRRAQKLPLLSWLGNSNMVDTFRKLHPYEKKFTRSDNQVKSRIDYILVSKDLGQGLIYCDILEADTVTNSDHAIVIAKMITGIRKKTRSLACEKRLKGKRWSFLLDKATEENWEDYKTKLDSLLEKKLNIKKNEYDLTYLESLNKDDLWDIIATSIIKSTRTTLPGKKSTVGNHTSEKKKESKNIRKDLKIIGSICQQCSLKVGQQINSADKYSINTKIARINSLYETEIEELSESTWTKERQEELKT